jgi:hypothetical protein
VSELNSTIASLHHQLVFWTIVVAIGLVIEYAKPIKNFFVDTFRWLLCGAKRPHLTAAIVGGILITIGVMMEGLIEFRASDTETKLADANERSLTDARIAVAHTEKENLKLRAAIADRDITSDQQNKIREALKAYSGKVVYVRSYPNHPESAMLIVEIKAALEPWIHLEDRTGELIGQSAPPGILFGIRIEPAQNERGFAEALVRTFRMEAKLSVEDLSPLGTVSSVTEILVGVRPLVSGNGSSKSVTSETEVSRKSRHLNPEQIARIASKLRRFPNQKINFFWFMLDSEIQELGDDIVKACCVPGGAGWDASITIEQKIRPFETGILVFVHPRPNVDAVKAAARALVSALKAENLVVNGPVENPDPTAVLTARSKGASQQLINPANGITVVIGKNSR